jgi:serine/threonine protein kinase
VENTHSTNGSGAGLLLAGRYRLGDAIGRGGMGKVWRAHDEVLHRTVAVKELTAALYVAEADRAILHARTQKEARAAARITHPGVVTVHDVLDHDNRPWIVMQYVDGPSLADAVKAADGHRIDAREAARIGLHVLGALRAAHTAGVLHRDVKPGNVLLASDGRVLLTDFGIAAIEGDVTITKTGELVGSIDYLAPERVQGAHPGPASDLWSL